ncbi:hypothetical protein BV898_12833 [Hypsibius exemplaris]|uniref:Uncharacterized protein n=1 Tax=Hypsibius exemplaris TaxID=2072580 RepID=A0A1W0WCH8_HYPEX|nr:hypothetical protein BV898_12833 [Hypsibius exemplaris]
MSQSHITRDVTHSFLALLLVHSIKATEEAFFSCLKSQIDTALHSSDCLEIILGLYRTNPGASSSDCWRKISGFHPHKKMSGPPVGRIPGQPLIHPASTLPPLKKPVAPAGPTILPKLIVKWLWRHKFSICIPIICFSCIVGDYQRTQRDKANLKRLGIPTQPSWQTWIERLNPRKKTPMEHAGATQ